MKHLDLFSGIGGFALATEMVWGTEVEHIFCDSEPFSQTILKKHWPHAKIYGDIKQLRGEEIGPVDLVTGGFPCQPFSSAGKRRGTEDDRHLWPEMLRLVRETSPRWVLGENVSGLLTWDGGMVLEQVLADLEAEGFEVQAFIVPAAGVGAPHKRDRVWIAAHSNRSANRGATGSHESSSSAEGVRQRDPMGQSGESNQVRFPSNPTGYGVGRRGTHRRAIQKRVVLSGKQNNGSAVRNEIEGCDKHDKPSTDSDHIGIRRHKRKGSKEGTTARSCTSWEQDWLEVATELCTLDDGLPNGLARPRGWRDAALKGAGNAIVPQVAAQILKAMKEIS